MANLLRNKQRMCQCCDRPAFSRGQARRQEQRAWRNDQLSALAPSFHEQEYESLDWDWDGTGSCDNWDLKDIRGVWSDFGFPR